MASTEQHQKKKKKKHPALQLAPFSIQAEDERAKQSVFAEELCPISSGRQMQNLRNNHFLK